MNKNELINKIYKIVISIVSILLGFFMILFAFIIYFKGKAIIKNEDPLYQIYNVDILSKYLKYLLIPFVLWVITIIVGIILHYVFPFKEKTKNSYDIFNSYQLLKNKVPNENKENNEELFIINEERKNRRLGFIIVSVVSLLFMIFPARYLFTFSNFTASEISAKDEAIKMAINVFPWIIGAFILFIGYLIYITHSIKKEINMIHLFLKTNKNIQIINDKQNKKELNINIVRACIGVISIIFIVLGIINGGVDNVLAKAINICTECIGLA